MENIFIREEQVVAEAVKLLNSSCIETEKDATNYKALLDEYIKLLKELRMLIKISDINQSEMNLVSKRLEAASNIDVLTGLYNRRYFNDMYEKEWLGSVRDKALLAACMVDIDFFKSYNDTYGHLKGDECLKLVAEAIKESALRPRDMVVRFGGEEFIVLLPETDIKGAAHVAATIIKNVEKLDIKHAGSSVTGSVTVSIGVAAITPLKKDSSSKLVNMADNALYAAKHLGRNCYSVI